ncbi:MAG: sulfite exporter TauE/SafE family protein [Bacillota bacterium]|nr:sulfite exporter TauE/SafE family protein [Bacillota bacterium]
MDVNWSLYLYTFLASIGGGIVQATTGFGFGIFVMVFFSLYLPLLSASALSSAISLFVSSTLVFKYRKHAQIKQVILPVICYLLISTSVILLAPSLDLHWLSIAFSVMMILLAVYMLFFSGKVKVRASAVTALSCSSLSGVASGLFGIGGPPMTLYYMTLFHDDKLAYMGTLQLFFLDYSHSKQCDTAV